MYIRWREIKYFVPGTIKEYKQNSLPIRIPGETEDYVQVTEWIGKNPFKIKKCCADLTQPIPSYLRAEVCTARLEGESATPLMTSGQAIQLLMKQKQLDCVAVVEMQSDILCHTDLAFREELVAKVLADGWRMFKVLNYKVVGFECPSTLFIKFALGLRTKL